MPSAQEVWLYYAAFIVIAILAFIRRRPRKGMRLKLNRHSFTSKSPVAVFANWLDLRTHSQGRSLNVIFNYNGHSWDAYEVLGLPAGSSIERVKEAYQVRLSESDDSSKAFLQAAYKAINAPRVDPIRKA